MIHTDQYWLKQLPTIHIYIHIHKMCTFYDILILLLFTFLIIKKEMLLLAWPVSSTLLFSEWLYLISPQQGLKNDSRKL